MHTKGKATNKTTFTRPALDGEPPDTVIKSSKSKFSKQELLEFFVPLFSKWENEKSKTIEDFQYTLSASKIDTVNDTVDWCMGDLKKFINTFGG